MSDDGREVRLRKRHDNKSEDMENQCENLGLCERHVGEHALPDRAADSPKSSHESIIEQLCEGCQDVRRRILENFRNLDIDRLLFEVDSDNEEEDGSKSDSGKEVVETEITGPESEGFLSSQRRKTLAEIDWDEISMFAQQNLLDSNDLQKMERLTQFLRSGKDELQVAFKAMENLDMHTVAEQTQKCIRCMIHTGKRGFEVLSHWELPDWLKDNDFLWHGHRPPLPSFKECFGSMFRVHTETGNIWTHLIGLVLFVIAMLFIFLRPVASNFVYPNGWEEYVVFGAFFLGAILCLLFSWLFHTCYCHSVKVHSLFSKLDYSGIACLIMGSFVPCLYYGFYCKTVTRLVYLVIISLMGLLSILVSLWDKFATPKYRPVRAGVFLALGCSGVIPSIHMVISHGFLNGVRQAALGWLFLMGVLYILGAVLYALRIPERFFPKLCNIWCQSHQLFHVLVVLAAFVHLHGVCHMAHYRINVGKNCTA